MRVRSATLWRSEGTGFFNSWIEYVDLRKRADGSFCVALNRAGIDYPGRATVFRSAPFRTPKQLFRVLLDPPGEKDGWDEMPSFAIADVLVMLASLIEFDPPFGLAALRAYAHRLSADAVQPVAVESASSR